MAIKKAKINKKKSKYHFKKQKYILKSTTQLFMESKMYTT
jgi:hypothetical protein